MGQFFSVVHLLLCVYYTQPHPIKLTINKHHNVVNKPKVWPGDDDDDVLAFAPSRQ